MLQRKLMLSMQITLDGYVSGKDNTADWLITGDDDWSDLFTDLDRADTYLLGRKMYPLYSEHWQSVLNKPVSDSNELKFAKLAEKTQHIVFTKGNFTPGWTNTRVAHDVNAEVSRLKKDSGKNIIAWGGALFAASLIESGLVDEYRFALNPTILANGKSLFSHVGQRRNLQLISSKALQSGLIIIRYQAKTK